MKPTVPVLFLSVLFVVSNADAQSWSDEALQETYISENYSGDNNDGNNLQLGYFGGEMNILVDFDIAGLQSSYPPGSYGVTDATLYLYQYDNLSAPGTCSAFIYIVEDNWNEGTVTWNLNENYGVDVYTTTTSSDVFTCDTNGWKSFDVTDVIDAWHSNQYANPNGLLVRRDVVYDHFIYFRDFENGAPNYIPYLEVSLQGIQTCNDSDGDGYGNPGDASCPNGGQTDCNDNNASIHPGATETCNGTDDDCDGQVDEGGVCPEDCDNNQDDDGDGLVDCNDPDCTNDPNCVCGCSDNDNDGYYPTNCSDPNCSNTTDCNDNNASVHPGADEECDSIDNDCDGQTDEGLGDQHQDCSGMVFCDNECLEVGPGYTPCTDWVGDGFCDDGTGGWDPALDFDCAAWNYDGGDCGDDDDDDTTPSDDDDDTTPTDDDDDTTPSDDDDDDDADDDDGENDDDDDNDDGEYPQNQCRCEMDSVPTASTVLPLALAAAALLYRRKR